MAKFELKLPKMGESVAEATITSWLKKVGDKIAADEAVLEIATDKVDSEVPSEVSGTLVEILFNVDDVVLVGQTIAIIDTEGGSATVEAKTVEVAPAIVEIEKAIEVAKEVVHAAAPIAVDFSSSEKFFSPLVKNIAKEEGVSIAELETIKGSGKEGRVTKDDIISYVKDRANQPVATAPKAEPIVAEISKPEVKAELKIETAPEKKIPVSVNGQDEIIEMDRMRKLISGYMVSSLQTSAHVQSFIEVDVTNIVKTVR